MRYVRLAKYNPYGLVTFFLKAAKRRKKEGKKITFLSSHPATADRIQKALGEITNKPYS